MKGKQSTAVSVFAISLGNHDLMGFLCFPDVRHCPDSRVYLLCVWPPWSLPSAERHSKWWHQRCCLDWHLCWPCTFCSVYPWYHWSHQGQQDLAAGGKCSKICLPTAAKPNKCCLSVPGLLGNQPVSKDSFYTDKEPKVLLDHGCGVPEGDSCEDSCTRSSWTRLRELMEVATVKV